MEDALRKEVDQVNSSSFTDVIGEAAPPKRFTTRTFTPFKRDYDPKSHLKHFRGVIILYKGDDALMCKLIQWNL